MSKVNLSDLVNLQNETTAVNLINGNSHLIETGFENTLSRDGTAPNSMNADFDMNSNRILNLPIPGSATEPLRLQDLSDFIGGGTISTIPEGGTARQYLGKNSSADFDVDWLDTRDVYDVRNFGVVGNGTSNDAPALQTAIDSLQSVGGGILVFPAGFTVLCASSITIGVNNPSVTLRGCMNKNETSSLSPNVSTIVYSGTGSRFIDARDSRGLTIENLRIQYSSLSFSGKLIDASGITPGSTVAGYTTIRECILEPNTDRTGTATLLNLEGSVDVLVDQTFFRHGFPFIRGQASIGQNVRTTIRNCTFVKGDATAGIINGGESWVLEGNSFENNSSGAGAIYSDSAPIYSKAMSWIGNWFGDITASGTNWIDGNFQGMVFIGNQMAGDISTGGTGIKLNNSTGVYISGNRFELLTTAVNCVTASTGLKMGPNTFTSVTTPVTNASNCLADDFTLASTGITAISPDAVTYAKMQNISGPGKVLGRATGGAGDTEELTLGLTFTNVGLTVQTGPMSGDVSSPINSFATTLATVNSNVGTFGSATQVPQVTVNGKGLTTAAANVTVTPAVGSITGLATGVATFLATPSSSNLKAAVTDETGSGALVFATSPALVTPTGIVKGDVGLGNVDNTSDATKNAASVTLTNKTITAPIISTISNTGTLTLPTSTDTLVGKATTDTLTNKTYDTAGTGNSFSINGVAATANTGTGSVVRATSPTLVTPTLGVAMATSINGNTLTTGTYTLTGAAAKTLTFNNSLTLAGTDATTMTFPSTSATVARTDAANTFTGHQTVEGVTSTGATGTGKFVFDTSPTLVTPALGTPSSGVLSSCTGLPVSSITGVGQLTNSLGADVALNNTANYFDGPSIAQGSAGTWWVSGTVTLLDNTSSETYLIKLWDGTTVIASSVVFTAIAVQGSVSLSGYLASPAGNLRISVKALSGTTGAIKFNNSSNTKDSTISAYRIA